MSESVVSTYFDGEPPRVLAHRGLALDAPENTLLAFAHAVAIGVTHIETDVHRSHDGVAVVAHEVRRAADVGDRLPALGRHGVHGAADIERFVLRRQAYEACRPGFEVANECGGRYAILRRRGEGDESAVGREPRGTDAAVEPAGVGSIREERDRGIEARRAVVDDIAAGRDVALELPLANDG